MWASERLKSFIAHDNADALSLETVALKLDPESAWEQFAPELPSGHVSGIDSDGI